MLSDRSTDLQAALRQLETWQEAPPAAKQRRFARFAARGEAHLLPGSTNGDTIASPSVHIRDISRGGIGLLSSVPADAGAFWQVQLSDDKVVVATIPAVCRFCREVVEGAYLIGVEFGIEAGVLMALGVPMKEIALGDEPEAPDAASGDFVGPESLDGLNAA